MNSPIGVFKNKRGALELSITAIVVLIIAITVLGLGVGFIKKNFDKSEDLIGDSFKDIKNQLKTQMKESGELLVFSVPEEVTKGTPDDIQIGVLNTDANPASADDPRQDSICFRVEVKCIKPFAPDAECVAGKGSVVVGGYDSSTGDAIKENNWFKRLNSQFDLKNYEGEVYDGVLLVKGVKSDTYSMELNVYKAENNAECSDAEFPTEQVPYASETFTLSVV